MRRTEEALTREARYPGLKVGVARYGRTLEFARSVLRGQFGRPHGLIGAVVGAIMARDRSNQERIRWTLELLKIEPTDRLLEVGFGPGFGVAHASRMAPDGLVYGVDHSEVMLRQASRRNAEAIKNGNVVLSLGSSSSLPSFDAQFDKIFSINSFHFWEQPVECLRHLRGVLKIGGILAITLQPRSRSASDGTTREIGAEIVDAIGRSGFSEADMVLKRMKPVAAVCVRAVK